MGTFQLPETSLGNIYLRVLEDAMAKFSHSEKMSEIFTQLADKFKEKEEALAPEPIGLSADPVMPIETLTAPRIEEPMVISTTIHSEVSAAQN